MSKFHGRRDRTGDWHFEGKTATSTLRVFSAPLIVGALLAAVMLAYVVASGGWSFGTVSPNSCQAGDVSAQTFDCNPCMDNDAVGAQTWDDCDPCSDHDSVSAQTYDDCDPCPDNDSVSAETYDDCDICVTPSNGDAQIQTFDHPTCTPKPCVDASGDDVSADTYNKTKTPTPPPTPCETPTPSPSPTPSPTPTEPPTDTPTPSPSETPRETKTPGPSETPTEPPTDTPTTPPTETPTTPPTEPPTDTPTTPPTRTPTETPPPTDTPTPPPTEPPTDTPTTPPTEPPTATPEPTPKTDISLVKSDDPDPVTRGGTLSYNITVTNIGSADAEHVVVTDTLPGDVTLVSATPTQGSCEGNVCLLGTIPVGQAAGIAIVVTVDLDANAVFTNLACAAMSTFDKNLSNNCDDEDSHIVGVTPSALPATQTPRAMPNTGGLPGTGNSDARLLIGLGVSILIAGAFAASVARRRSYPTR